MKKVKITFVTTRRNLGGIVEYKGSVTMPNQKDADEWIAKYSAAPHLKNIKIEGDK